MTKDMNQFLKVHKLILIAITSCLFISFVSTGTLLPTD